MSTTSESAEAARQYVGKEVKLYQKNPYTEREEVVSATLLSNNGGPIFRINNEITFVIRQDHLPGVPENFISKPTLSGCSKTTCKPAEVEASYLPTHNLAR